jgi:hypothetical protein
MIDVEQDSEAALYAPVKRFFESHGLTIKGEVSGCDIVGVSADDPALLVVCELKVRFNLELVLQGIERAAACDEVWLAARRSGNGKGREHDRRFRSLCRSLGFGLIAVSRSGAVEVLLSPAALPPRRNPRRRSAIVEEHRRRRGDPAVGGSNRRPVMTAYRQDAYALAMGLAEGPRQLRDLRLIRPTATKIVRRNVYGWFARVARGSYELTDSGRAALLTWAERN